MKIVACENCGLKYKLSDDDDISTYECSSCAGNLELIEKYHTDEDTNKSRLFSKPFNDDETVVQCEECNLKYKLNKKENIDNYECESCGGSLRYIDKNLQNNSRVIPNNEEIIPDHVQTNTYEEIIPDHVQTNTYEEIIPDHVQTNTYEEIIPDHVQTNTYEEIIPDHVQTNTYEEIIPDHVQTNTYEENTPNFEHSTARTSIPEYIMSRFEREFDITKVSNYDVIKNHLKNNFYNNLNEDYPDYVPNDQIPNITKKTFIDKISIKNIEPDSQKHDLIPEPNEQMSTFHYIYILIGAFIGIVGTLDIITSNRGYGIIFLVIGLVIIIFGIYKTRDFEDNEKRGKIIREKLLTLPEEFYVLYYVKVPKSSSGINHVVIGPTGVYSILSKKYYSKENSKLKSEKENNQMINSTQEQLLDVSSNPNKFQYHLKRNKFESNNAIKQKSLKLGENLINFLNENGFENLFVEPLVGFVNNDVAVINMPLTDEDLFLEELLNTIKNSPRKLDSATVHKCAVILSQYSTKCSS